MKKTLLFICFAAMLCSFNATAQTLTPAPSTVENGGTVVLTAENETIFRNITGNISFSDLGLVTTPTGYRIYLSITDLNRTQEYDNEWSKPSKFSFKITNTTQENVTVTIPFKCTLQNSHPDDPGIINTNYIINVTVTVKPTAPTVFYNDAKSQTFFKNDCGTGFESDPVTYSVPANKYSSTISKADANSKAQTEINANGQNKANTEGVCKQVYYNTELSSAPLTKNNCTGGSIPGTQVIYVVPANKHKSLVSQADADNMAQSDIAMNSQNYANAVGTCIPIPYITGSSWGYRTQDYTYVVNNTSPGDIIVWSVPNNAATIMNGQGTSTLGLLFSDIAGTANYPFSISVTVTKSDGSVRSASFNISSRYCANCPK